jgi:dipeptidyl aminopeptidase/acylaminoacyl peptidase
MSVLLLNGVRRAHTFGNGVVASLLIFGGIDAAWSDAAVPPLAAFAALPAQTDVVLSPDGHLLAWAEHDDTATRVVIFDVAARKAKRVIPIPDRGKLRGLLWNDNDTLLASIGAAVEPGNTSRVSGEFVITTAIMVDGGETVLPLARLIRIRISKPHTVIMQSGRLCPNCLIEVDTRTGAGITTKVAATHTVGWVVDRDGHPVAREDWDWKSSEYRLYALVGTGLKELLHRDDNDPPLVAGLLPDGSAVILLAANGRPHQAAWSVPLDGSPPTLLAQDPDADVTAAYFDNQTGDIVGFFVGGSKNGVIWISPEAQHRHEVLQRAFPNRTVTPYGWTADGTKTLARVESATVPPVYYLVDFATHKADIAAEEYPALGGIALGEFREISYQARDGTVIPAYLTLPAGKSAQAAPLVVLPHGGPNERDLPNFNWIVEFLASRGYAVLQPQFRGSTGFGDAFREAGYRQWGGLMQDDVTDGVRAMIEQGIADPHRVCIAGASYGGYAALAGAAFTPQLYACAISINGVSDLPALLNSKVPMYVPRGRIYSTSLDQWQARIGKPGDSALEKKSPINAVAAISAPVLIVYGTSDGVVPNEQSERMAAALTRAGKSVKVVQLPAEDHWLSRNDTRIQMLSEVDAFLREHLVANPAP